MIDRLVRSNERVGNVSDLRIYAIVVTEEHDNQSVIPGNQLLIRTKDKTEQDVIVREIALAVTGDVIRLSNGMILNMTGIR